VNIGIWWIILRETDHLEDLSVVGSKILKWMLNTSIGRTWKKVFWVRIGKMGGPSGTRNNLGSYTKSEEFLDYP